MTPPLDAGLMRWPDEPARLTGSRCETCGWTVFPVRDACGRCGADGVRTVELPTRGTLWSLTTQEFELKEPYCGPPGPFVLGYVDLGTIVVESWIDAPVAAVHDGTLAIGRAVELAVVPFDAERVTYAFRPVGGDGAAA